MKTQAVEISLEQMPTPDMRPGNGVYEGTLNGYELFFRANGVTWRARTVLGIRTPEVPVIVTVTSDEITVEVDPSESVKNRSR
jgi:hypothetical protein